jgi:hypothetical protein
MKLLYKINKIALSMLILSYFTACSDTEFRKSDTSLESYHVNVGQVDILFVVDNSGSMSAEQRRMADSFPNFVQGLDLAGLDYRIGIITTDVESRDNPLVNQGKLQNGNFIQFSNGDYYLTPSTDGIEAQFRGAIERPETEICENSGYRDCPSDDERGIYSAYLAINANKQSFFRKDGHLALIFLTDEDVRGFGTREEQYPYKLPEALDYPENLFKVISTRLGQSTDVSVHAIITDTEQCRAAQMMQGGSSNIHGVIGSFYRSMTSPTNPSIIEPGSGLLMGDFASGQLVQGTVGSICSNDYVQELGSIKNVLSKTKSSERLRCSLISESDLDVRIDNDYVWELSENRREITFSPALPPGESFKLEYECPR